jgi:hypothetical protein
MHSDFLACGILLALCNSDSYCIRERATAELVAILERQPTLLSVLERVAEEGPAEMRRRTRLALMAYYSVAPSWYGKLPWIDMLPKDWPNRQEVIQCYLTRARQLQLEWLCYETWVDYRIATRLFVIDLLRNGRRREYVQRLLDIMAENELVYLMRRDAYFAQKE